MQHLNGSQPFVIVPYIRQYFLATPLHSLHVYMLYVLKCININHF